jgi:hypothetical protein
MVDANGTRLKTICSPLSHRRTASRFRHENARGGGNEHMWLTKRCGAIVHGSALTYPAEIVYEAVVMSLEDHAVHPEYTDRLQALLAYFAKSSLVTSMSDATNSRALVRNVSLRLIGCTCINRRPGYNA